MRAAHGGGRGVWYAAGGASTGVGGGPTRSSARSPGGDAHVNPQRGGGWGVVRDRGRHEGEVDACALGREFGASVGGWGVVCWSGWGGGVRKGEDRGCWSSATTGGLGRMDAHVLHGRRESFGEPGIGRRQETRREMAAGGGEARGRAFESCLGQGKGIRCRAEAMSRDGELRKIGAAVVCPHTENEGQGRGARGLLGVMTEWGVGGGGR